MPLGGNGGAPGPGGKGGRTFHIDVNISSVQRCQTYDLLTKSTRRRRPSKAHWRWGAKSRWSAKASRRSRREPSTKGTRKSSWRWTASRFVSRSDLVDYTLRFVVAESYGGRSSQRAVLTSNRQQRTCIVISDIREVITAAVVGFAY